MGYAREAIKQGLCQPVVKRLLACIFAALLMAGIGVPVVSAAARPAKVVIVVGPTGPGMTDRFRNAPAIRAPRGLEKSAKHWTTEAPLRMLMNNLDDEVAEKPGELVVYGGIGRAARNWECFDAIVAALRALGDAITVTSGV